MPDSTEIYKHPHNFNKKEEGLYLAKAWYPALKNKCVLYTNMIEELTLPNQGDAANNRKYESDFELAIRQTSVDNV